MDQGQQSRSGSNQGAFYHNGWYEAPYQPLTDTQQQEEQQKGPSLTSQKNKASFPPASIRSSPCGPSADVSTKQTQYLLTPQAQETASPSPGLYISSYAPPAGTRTRLPDHAPNSMIGEGRVQPDSDFIACPRMENFQLPCSRSFPTPELLREHLRDYHGENIDGPTKRELQTQKHKGGEED